MKIENGRRVFESEIEQLKSSISVIPNSAIISKVDGVHYYKSHTKAEGKSFKITLDKSQLSKMLDNVSNEIVLMEIKY